MTKTILTTGATGLVGSRLTELFKGNYDFRNMDLTTGVDITDSDSIARFIEKNHSDTLIHFAGFTNTEEAHEQSGDKTAPCYQINVGGTQNIAEIAKKEDLYLVHISTDFVFSGDKEEEYTETDLRSPIEWYGETKALAEEAVENALSKFAIIRISYPFRAIYGQKPDILAKTIQGIKERALPPQFTDSSFTPTFIDEIAKALVAVIEKEPTGIYHAVGSSHVSPYEFALSVAETFDLDSSLIQKGNLIDYQKTHNRPIHRHLNTSNAKIKNDLGLSFSTLSDALEVVHTQLIS